MGREGEGENSPFFFDGIGYLLQLYYEIGTDYILNANFFRFGFARFRRFFYF